MWYVAFCDDVRLVGPVNVVRKARGMLLALARQHLGLVEAPDKGSVVWGGVDVPIAAFGLTPDLSPIVSDMPILPPSMPGVVRRVLHDKHLGVIVGDSRLVSIAAVKRELLSKFESNHPPRHCP